MLAISLVFNGSVPKALSPLCQKEVIEVQTHRQTDTQTDTYTDTQTDTHIVCQKSRHYIPTTQNIKCWGDRNEMYKIYGSLNVQSLSPADNQRTLLPLTHSKVSLFQFFQMYIVHLQSVIVKDILGLLRKVMLSKCWCHRHILLLGSPFTICVFKNMTSVK